MSGQGSVLQPPTQPYSSSAQISGNSPTYGGLNNQPALFAPVVFEFRRVKVSTPEGSILKQFESAMPNLLAQVMTVKDFANRFIQINGFYAPQAQRIERNARIMKISTFVTLLLLILAALANGLAGGRFIVSYGIGLSTVFVIMILLGVRSYVQTENHRKLHAQVGALLETFNTTDRARRLRWFLTTERVYTQAFYRRNPTWHEEPTVKLAMSM